MPANHLRVSDDASPAAWIAPRLGGDFGAVGRTLPRGYPGYVRICHPAVGQDRSLVGWSEVARSTGRRAHSLMQWHALVGSPDALNITGSQWPGSNPQRGNLAPEVLGPLCELLGDTRPPLTIAASACGTATAGSVTRRRQFAPTAVSWCVTRICARRPAQPTS
jgi:hypothetical protein